VVGAGRHHIAHPALADAAAQLAAAVHFIAGHEGGADPQGLRAVQQGASKLRLAGERHLFGDAGQLAVFLIGSARFGQVKRRVDQRMPAAGGVCQGHRHLAQGDPAHCAAVLAGCRVSRRGKHPAIVGYRGSSDYRVLIVSHNPS
jgi:hypothetical protein